MTSELNPLKPYVSFTPVLTTIDEEDFYPPVMDFKTFDEAKKYQEDMKRLQEKKIKLQEEEAKKRMFQNVLK